MTIPKYIHFSSNPKLSLTETITFIGADKVAVLVDENTKKHCLDKLSDFTPNLLIEISSGEKNKNLDTCQHIWRELTEGGFSRKSILINLGGGVIGDMGGFCASTFKRGIKFINIPTTLLAAVDANIGGKLGIDFMGFKNHLGIFQDPAAVIVSDIFLDTLPSRELRSGFAEVIKHGLISDKAYWNKIKAGEFPNFKWTEIIKQSIAIKGDVVDRDPLEQGLRKILNFGHTLGHAVETYYLNNNKSLLHGEAIACGMILEAHLSLQKSIISQEQLEEISSFITSVYGKITIPSLEELMPLMSQDKKNIGNDLSFSLIDAIGSCTYNQSSSEKMISEAITYYDNFK